MIVKFYDAPHEADQESIEEGAQLLQAMVSEALQDWASDAEIITFHVTTPGDHDDPPEARTVEGKLTTEPGANVLPLVRGIFETFGPGSRIDVTSKPGNKLVATVEYGGRSIN